MLRTLYPGQRASVLLLVRIPSFLEQVCSKLGVFLKPECQYTVARYSALSQACMRTFVGRAGRSHALLVHSSCSRTSDLSALASILVRSPVGFAPHLYRYFVQKILAPSHVQFSSFALLSSFQDLHHFSVVPRVVLSGGTAYL